MGLRTPLYDWHVASGAQIVDFGGWDMPVVYTSIIEEHHATRKTAGLFDISHMGRFRFDGPDAVRFLDHVLTNRVEGLKPGQARYSLVLDESGGTLDDVLVTRLADYHLLVVNASNREKLLKWFEPRLVGFDARLRDMTFEWGMFAVQGPGALSLVQPFVEPKLDRIHYYFAAETTHEGEYAIVSRTGYTGEDGVELIVPASRVVALWQRLLDAGTSLGARPVALGARDTLRLEAGMPLYGHELSEAIDPLQAGLGWAVKAKAKDFIGKEALASKDPARPVRVGLRLGDKRIARQGFAVTRAGAPIGTVTSGTFGPTLQASIAMAYVPPPQSAPGTPLDVDIRGKPVPATVVELPFYSRERPNHG